MPSAVSYGRTSSRRRAVSARWASSGRRARIIESGPASAEVRDHDSSKSPLLRGDEDDVPINDRRWYQEVLAEPDAERQLRLGAHNACLVKQRVGPVFGVIRSAATSDPDIAALWQRIQTEFHDNQRRVVASVAEKGALRPELDVDRATDILWTLNHPDVWLLLVGERGWTPEAFEAWFADAACAQLLA